MATPALAASDTDKGSIEIQCLYGERSQAVSGLSVKLWLVADMVNSAEKYCVTDDFSDMCTAAKLRSITTASDNIDVSQSLSTAVKQNNISADLSGTSNASGRVFFSDIEQGVYLMVIEAAGDYSAMPALISVPQADPEDADELLYDVVVYAKIKSNGSDEPTNPTYPTDPTTPTVPTTPTYPTYPTNPTSYDPSDTAGAGDANNNGGSNVNGKGEYEEGKTGDNVKGILTAAFIFVISAVTLAGVISVLVRRRRSRVSR